MTTFRFDISVPALILTGATFLIWSCVTYRGFARREFRILARSGWHRFERGSFNYWSYTGMNLVLEAAFLQCVYWSLFDGSRMFGK
jgi:hypothetical protein